MKETPRPLPYRSRALLLGAAAAVLAALPAPAQEPEPRPAEGEAPKTEAPAGPPPFESLLVWNAEAIFGGKLTLLGDDRIEVTYDSAGQMPRGFEGEGILDEKSKDMQGGNKKFITRDKKTIPNLAGVGISAPAGKWTIWTSRFPLAGEPKVRFDLRLPGLVTSQCGFLVRLNVEGKSYLETNFFNSLEKKAPGKSQKKETPLKEYSAHPMKWFNRNRPDGVPVEVLVESDKFKVAVDGKDLVAMDKASDVPRGKVAIGYRKIVFTLQNLKISGKMDRPWCEAELKRLEGEGKLKSKDPIAIPGAP